MDNGATLCRAHTCSLGVIPGRSTAAVTQATFKHTAVGRDSAVAEKGNVGKRQTGSGGGGLEIGQTLWPIIKNLHL